MNKTVTSALIRPVSVTRGPVEGGGPSVDHQPDGVHQVEGVAVGVP